VEFVFDIDKTVAAAAFLAKKNDGSISTFFLMKMLYAAERDALSSWHRPITGDTFFAMKKGPILSRTYSLVNYEIAGSNSDMIKWAKHFPKREGHTIQLKEDPDFEFLSQLEVEALEKAFGFIMGLEKSSGVIADVLHKMWPEWKDPTQFGAKAVAMTLEDILSEVVEDESMVREIADEIRAVGSAKAALQVRRA
jgi:hypothetical protein